MKPDQLDQLALLLINGRTVEHAESVCLRQFKMSRAEAKSAVIDARQKITAAADFNRHEQFGLAVTRVNDLYMRAVDSGDVKDALSAQKELNRMMGLYDRKAACEGEPDPIGSGSATATLNLIRGHLLPLGLASEDYPIEEHARLAAAAVMDRSTEGGDG